MSESSNTEKAPSNGLQKIIGKIVDSNWAGWIMGLPPFSWVTRSVARRLVEHQIAKTAIQESQLEEVPDEDLEATLQQIVSDVVALGYAGAMVATYEQGDALPVRAIKVDPKIASMDQIHQWEETASKIARRPLSITDPQIARVFVHRKKDQGNLSVQAFQAGGQVISDDLYDLFTPIAPPISKEIVGVIQEALGIEQVIAVPFFLETAVDGQTQKELVGNLFAAKRDKISLHDKLVLSIIGRQAAAAIENERRRLQIEVAQELVFAMQSKLRSEENILQRIVDGVVEDLNYVGAMVATYEPDGSLPVRAIKVDPNIASMDQIHQWEKDASKISRRPLSITEPEIARVFVHRQEDQSNLSVKAFQAGGPVCSDDLYDLFTPIAPPISKEIVGGIQQALGIEQVIAVPFFLEKLFDGQPQKELVGNLFAATRSRKFSAGEIGLLRTFGQQAAAGIRNARLYRKSEERRLAAQIFGKMAFSSAAYVHEFRNHIGVIRMHLQLLTMLDKLSPQDRQEQIDAIPKTMARLDEVADILENLHEPFRQIPDEPTQVNPCLTRALNKAITDQETLYKENSITVKVELTEDLPAIMTSPPMLTEAFKVLIKNAVEALRKKGQAGELYVKSDLREGDHATIEVSISDTGTGIEPEHLSKVFEMRWTTKKQSGLGFGLFWTRDYVEGLGGRIEVESVWQKGTTFRTSLPVLVE